MIHSDFQFGICISIEPEKNIVKISILYQTQKDLGIFKASLERCPNLGSISADTLVQIGAKAIRAPGKF